MGTVRVDEEAWGNSGEFTPIPVGTKIKVSVYDLTKVKVKTGDNAGKDQLDLTVKVTEDGPYKGREIRFTKLPLYSSRGSWALVAFAEAVGWHTEKGVGVDVPDELSDTLGTEFTAKIGQRTGTDNNIYNTVTGYAKLKSGGGTPEPAKKKWGEV